LVVAVSSDVDTGEMPVLGDANQTAAAGEPVGRVNLSDEPDPDEEWIGPPFDALSASDNAPSDGIREKVIFGVLAVLMMVLALVVILQGVFEQKMPV
jgi:hypothetical protein